MQQRLGVPSQWVTPDEIRALNPHIELDDIYGGTFCGEDGWVDTYAATVGYAKSGAADSVSTSSRVRKSSGSMLHGDRIRGVRTAAASVETPLVILCTGPHTRLTGALAGVEIPVDPYRRMSFITEPFDSLPSTLPMTIDFSSGLYFHPESGGFLFGMGNREESSTFEKTVDEDWMGTTVEALVERCPVFEEASILNGWAGFYEVTPDDNPVLGFVGDVEGLAVAAGFSGHGFMQGPAIGAAWPS